MKRLIVLFAVIYSLGAAAQNELETYTREGNYSMQHDDYVTAIKKYSKALEYKANEKNGYKIADLYVFRAWCRYSLQNSEDAQRDLDEALKLKPEYTKAYFLKSTIYFAGNKLDQCIEWCDKGLNVKPNDDDLNTMKAQALAGQKKYNASNAIFFTMLEENPKSTRLLKYVGSNYRDKKDWDSAVYYLSKAIDINPLDYLAFYDRGLCLAEKKEFKTALEDMEKAMAIDSTMKEVGYNNIAFFIKSEEKDYKGAIGYYDKAIELNPKMPNAWCNRGFAKLQLGDLKGAYKDIRHSLELDSKNSYAYKNLALVNLKDGKKNDACYNLKKALDLGYTETYDEEAETLLKEHCK